MSKHLADRFFSELLKGHLKPEGFKKKGRTVTRDRGSFVECFQFRGSRWNDRSRPWKFSIEVGLQFPDLPRMQPDKDFPHTHACDHIEKVISAPPDLELTKDNYEVLLSEVADLVKLASGALPTLAQRIYPLRKTRGRQSMFLSRGI